MSTVGRVCVIVGKSVVPAVATQAALDGGATVCVRLSMCVPACVRGRSNATVGGGSHNIASGG